MRRTWQNIRDHYLVTPVDVQHTVAPAEDDWRQRQLAALDDRLAAERVRPRRDMRTIDALLDLRLRAVAVRPSAPGGES